MDINAELEKYKKYASIEILNKHTQLALSFFPEEVLYLIPNFQMGADGPYLKSFAAVTKNILCEMNIATEEFDFCNLNTIYGYRIKKEKLEVVVSEEEKNSYDIINVIFTHNVGASMITKLSFIGDDFEDWLNGIKQALPVTMLLHD